MYHFITTGKCKKGYWKWNVHISTEGSTWYLILFTLWNGFTLTTNQQLDRRSEYSKQRLYPSLCPRNKYCMGQAYRKLKTLINEHINSIKLRQDKTRPSLQHGNSVSISIQPRILNTQNRGREVLLHGK